MAYYHGSGYGSSGETGAVVSLMLVALIILIVVLVIGLFLLFRCGVLIVRVFSRVPKSRALWISLGLCLLLCLAGCILAALFQSFGFLALAGLGLLQFLITCKAVEIDNSQLFLREKNDLVEQVIHPTSWWADYNA